MSFWATLSSDVSACRQRQPRDLRLVRVHQDLGHIIDGGDHVDLVVGPPVFAECAVFARYVVDGCETRVSTSRGIGYTEKGRTRSGKSASSE